MKVNEEKTEIVVFEKNNPTAILNVKGTAVESKESIKACSEQSIKTAVTVSRSKENNFSITSLQLI